MYLQSFLTWKIALSAGAVEYTASLQRGKTPPNECPGYNTKQSDEASVILELWGIRSTPSLPLLPGSLWPGVVASDRVLSMC